MALCDDERHAVRPAAVVDQRPVCVCGIGAILTPSPHYAALKRSAL
jgi:hypothetical protein